MGLLNKALGMARRQATTGRTTAPTRTTRSRGAAGSPSTAMAGGLLRRALGRRKRGL